MAPPKKKAKKGGGGKKRAAGGGGAKRGPKPQPKGQGPKGKGARGSCEAEGGSCGTEEEGEIHDETRAPPLGERPGLVRRHVVGDLHNTSARGT